MGRDAVRLRRIEAWADGHRRRTRGVVQEQPGRLQGAAPYRICRTAEDQHGEDSEVQVARDGEGALSALSERRCIPASWVARGGDRTPDASSATTPRSRGRG